MLEIKLTIEIPDLVKAVQLLADAKGSDLQVVKALLDEMKTNEPAPQLDLQAALQAKEETPVAPHTAPDGPVLPAPVVTAPTVAPTVAAPAPAPVAPTAAPSYTIAQVARAGAMLLTEKPALQDQLLDLLHRYGAQTAQDIPQDRLGEFAAELRQMGAKI